MNKWWLLALVLLPVASFACPPKVPSDRACVHWTPPTKNTDGSTLTNLSGYRIYFGTSPSALTLVAPTGASNVEATIIPPKVGTWYFAVAAVASTGAESAKTNPVSKLIRLPAPTDGAIEKPSDGSIEPR